MYNTLRGEDGKLIDRSIYQSEIAAALKRELGGSHRAIKAVMRWTGVSESTAKNWIAGNHGPAGEHLIELLRHSDEVVAAVLIMSGRNELNIAATIQEGRKHLSRALHQIDELLAGGTQVPTK